MKNIRYTAAKIMREAAEIVCDSAAERDVADAYWTHRACCGALKQACDEIDAPEKAYSLAANTFAALYRPPAGAFWFGWPSSSSAMINRERCEHRVYALLLAAHFVHDGH